MHSHFPPLHILLCHPTLLIPLPLPLQFHPVLLFSKEVNKKLSYRGQNALSTINTYERNTVSEYILYLSVRYSLYWPDAWCSQPVPSSVRLSVCSFVRLLPTCERLQKLMNGFNANWHKFFPRRKGVNGKPQGSGSQRSRSEEAEVIFGSLAETRSLESSR